MEVVVEVVVVTDRFVQFVSAVGAVRHGKAGGRGKPVNTTQPAVYKRRVSSQSSR